MKIATLFLILAISIQGHANNMDQELSGLNEDSNSVQRENVFSGLFKLQNGSNKKCKYFGNYLKIAKTDKLISLAHARESLDKDESYEIDSPHYEIENRNYTLNLNGDKLEITILEFSDDIVKTSILRKADAGTVIYTQSFVLEGGHLTVKNEDVNYEGAGTHIRHGLNFLTEGHWGAMRIPEVECTYQQVEKLR